LTDAEWASLQIPAVCRILLKHCVRMSTRLAGESPTTAGLSPEEQQMVQLQRDFNFGQPFSMEQYEEYLEPLTSMGFSRVSALEGLLVSSAGERAPNIESALEYLVQADAATQQRKRQDAMARCGRQLVSSPVASSASPTPADTADAPDAQARMVTEARVAALEASLEQATHQLTAHRSMLLSAQQELKAYQNAECARDYKAFLAGVLSFGVVTGPVQEKLAKHRQTLGITDEIHNWALAQLGKSAEEFEKLKKGWKQAPSGGHEPDAECVICLDGPKDHVIFDCMHLALCGKRDCHEAIGQSCPVCLKPFTKIVKVFAT